MALSPGEQALVAKGQPVTSSFIPAESRARINAAIQAQQSSAPVVLVPAQSPQNNQPSVINSSTQIPFDLSKATLPNITAVDNIGGMLTSGQARTPVADIPPMPTLDSTTVMSQPDPSGLIQQIYQDELGRALGSKEGDKGALGYWTSRLQSGASAEQIRREIEGSPEGRAFDVSSAYTGLLGRTEAEIDPEGQQYWTQQLQTGALTPEQMRTSFLQSEEFLGDIAGLKAKSDKLAMVGAAQQGSIADLGSLFYNARKSGKKLPVELVELLGYSRTDDRQTAFEFAKGGQAYSEGLDALDKAIAEGDVAKANELKTALADEQGFFDYYQKNIATEEGQEALNLRRETATGDVFGVGDPGKYVTTVLDRIGDATMDVISNPYVQAAVAVFGGPTGQAISSIMQAAGTLDSGDDLSVTQIAAALAGTTELLNLEGGNWINLVPDELKETAQAWKKVLDEGWDEASSAFKNATGATSEQLAKVDDYFREVVGNENIETAEEFVTGLGDTIADQTQELQDLFAGQFGTLQETIDALANELAGIETGVSQDELQAALAAQAASQNRFTPQRGYQPGLAVNTEFDQPERSAVLDILNQPSTVRTA